ncbi:hypothetical protein [Pseudovibrio sp. Alg231-02]|uniref:hypothetical protein n=1 Tax=Pseudovibrio sp. Alg231-02 TaxID=1922223 RepID=UPI00131F426E|nr:hypothetical protein [Pseudovibrio sp. Alg231-02]
MRNYSYTFESSDSMSWKMIMGIAAISKAAIVGATLGLATLGALNVTHAAEAVQWLNETKSELFFDYFAIGGGVFGAIGQTVKIVFFR